MEVNPIDLPALRAVIAGVREKIPGLVLASRDERHSTGMLYREAASDLTTLASACERLAEENERLVGEIGCACNALTDSIMASGNDARTNLHWVAKLRRVITPAPAGKGEG